MRRVAGQISYRAVRNHGTIGGSVALADPAADWPVLPDGARCDAADRRAATACASQRVADFVRGPYETTLTTGEIIMGFDVPSPAAPLRWGFAKVARKSGAFANSIAIATMRRAAMAPESVVLGAAGRAADPAAQRRQADPRPARTTNCARRSPPTSSCICPMRMPIKSGCTPRPSCAPSGT